MANPVPTVEPTQLYIGDSLQWDKELEDYPADEWLLTYKLLPQTSGTVQSITGSEASDHKTHEIRIVAATTATWTAGDYWMVGYVQFEDNRFQIYAGALTILANPATATTFDGRSYLQRILDLIDASIEANEAPRNVIRYSYGGVVSEVRTLDDALKARERIIAAIANEEAQKSGQQRRILTRFLKPR